MSVRGPVVAGAFYPSEYDDLTSMIEKCFEHSLGPGVLPDGSKERRNIVALVSPHAGYIYSGPVAAHGYLQLSKQKPPDAVILLGPNHTGFGAPVSMWGKGKWKTPLGKVPIDEELAIELFESSNVIEYDEMGHLREHSIEVHLPFLQYIYKNFKIVPLCMGSQDLDTCRALGETIGNSITGKNVLIIASTDLTHQEPESSANRKDRLVIDSILAMDEKRLQQTVNQNRITMCGYGPVSVALVASKKLGAEKADLLAYHTSGDITGDRRAVVGYASLKITK